MGFFPVTGFSVHCNWAGNSFYSVDDTHTLLIGLPTIVLLDHMTITMSHSLILMYSLPLATLVLHTGDAFDNKSTSTRFITTVKCQFILFLILTILLRSSISLTNMKLVKAILLYVYVMIMQVHESCFSLCCTCKLESLLNLFYVYRSSIVTPDLAAPRLANLWRGISMRYFGAIAWNTLCYILKVLC